MMNIYIISCLILASISECKKLRLKRESAFCAFQYKDKNATDYVADCDDACLLLPKVRHAGVSVDDPSSYKGFYFNHDKLKCLPIPNNELNDHCIAFDNELECYYRCEASHQAESERIYKEIEKKYPPVESFCRNYMTLNPRLTRKKRV